MYNYYNLVCNLISNNITISAMESCSGGLLCNLITNVENCSKTLIGGYVTYSTEQKIKCGVSKDIIDKYTVYSNECAIAMAEAVRRNTGSNVGIGITGVLGNVDKNNPNAKLGKIFYAFASDSLTEFFTMELTEFELCLSREKQKKIVVSEVFDMLESCVLKGLC